MACDLAVASDLAVFGQAGPRHGSAPVGGSTDFLPWFLTIEDAMWSWFGGLEDLLLRAREETGFADALRAWSPEGVE